jgi:hypothetical protein
VNISSTNSCIYACHCWYCNSTSKSAWTGEVVIIKHLTLESCNWVQLGHSQKGKGWGTTGSNCIIQNPCGQYIQLSNNQTHNFFKVIHNLALEIDIWLELGNLFTIWLFSFWVLGLILWGSLEIIGFHDIYFWTRSKVKINKLMCEQW